MHSAKNDFFLTFNPLAAFTKEVEEYLQGLCDSYICVREHESTNAHCHIVSLGITARDHKALNDKIKKKYPTLRGSNQLVIKLITSDGVYNYISKEYNGKNWQTFKNQIRVYNCPAPTEDYFKNLKDSYKLHQNTKSLSGKFNLFWFKNQNRYHEISFNFALVLCFREFCKEFEVKDCTHRTFSRMKQYLYLQLYPNLWLQDMCEKEDLMSDYITYGIEINHIKPKKPTKMDIHMEEVFGKTNPDFNEEKLIL